MTQTTKLEYLNQEIIENKLTKKQKKKTKKAGGDLLDEEKHHSWEDIVVLDQFECLLKQIHRVLFRKLTPNLSIETPTEMVQYNNKSTQKYLEIIFQNQVI